jgi:hypothetical protein
MDHCVSVVRGLQTGVNEICELSDYYVSVLQGRGLAGETSSTPYGTLVQCCTMSAGKVRRSLLSTGPLLNKCSISSLVWLCVLLNEEECVCSAHSCCDTEQRSASQPACILPE